MEEVQHLVVKVELVARVMIPMHQVAWESQVVQAVVVCLAVMMGKADKGVQRRIAWLMSVV